MVFFWLLGLFFFSIAGIAIYRMFAFRKESQAIMTQRFKRVQPLIDTIDADGTPTEADILPFAQDIRSRYLCYQLLESNEMEHLFPSEWNTFEKATESNLVNWLEFPTELDAVPDDIHYLEQITFAHEHDNVHYHVFQYRTKEPHWAAKEGWLLGVVGPFFDDSKPYDNTIATFSRMKKIIDASPEEEARWVHENIALSNEEA